MVSTAVGESQEVVRKYKNITPPPVMQNSAHAYEHIRVHLDSASEKSRKFSPPPLPYHLKLVRYNLLSRASFLRGLYQLFVSNAYYPFFACAISS